MVVGSAVEHGEESNCTVTHCSAVEHGEEPKDFALPDVAAVLLRSGGYRAMMCFRCL